MNLIGKKIRGFRFESKIGGINYNPNMDKYIGEIGEIISHHQGKSVRIKIKDRIWTYPLPEALKHIIEEEEPIIPELGHGVKMEVSDDEEFWHSRIVIAKYKGRYITESRGFWKHARPIPVKKLTMEELEKLVGFKFEIV